jgi:hypothetical protein
MRTRDEIEAELERLGWRITAGPTQTPAGWKVTGQYGTASVPLTDSTELGVLEDLLRYAQRRGGSKR